VHQATATLARLGAKVVSVALPERQIAQHLFKRIASSDRLAHIRRSLGSSRMYS